MLTTVDYNDFFQVHDDKFREMRYFPTCILKSGTGVTKFSAEVSSRRKCITCTVTDAVLHTLFDPKSAKMRRKDFRQWEKTYAALKSLSSFHVTYQLHETLALLLKYLPEGKLTKGKQDPAGLVNEAFSSGM